VPADTDTDTLSVAVASASVTDTSDGPAKASALPWITDAVAGPLAAGAAKTVRVSSRSNAKATRRRSWVMVRRLISVSPVNPWIGDRPVVRVGGRHACLTRLTAPWIAPERFR